MKFMRLGTKVNNFFSTGDGVRSVSSNVPPDLLIQINNTRYLLHKFPLLPRCGLLQHLCAVSSESGKVLIGMHDIPGGENAFELCVKFCYGVKIILSCHNFVLAFYAAKFLRMTDAMEKGNLVSKLEAFFTSCVLKGWKDSIITLETTNRIPKRFEEHGISHQCIDSMCRKILTHPSEVRWKFTYTRSGYAEKQHRSVPKDWWTEDISDLDISLFHSVITSIRSTPAFPSQLIGEALHVYACKWILNMHDKPEPSLSQAEEGQKKLRILESIVNLIPTESGAVSVGFIIKLITVTIILGGSRSVMVDLVKKAGSKLHEATVKDLQYLHNIELVKVVTKSFLVESDRGRSQDKVKILEMMIKVGKLVDSFMQIVAKDADLPVVDIVSLAKTLPDEARPQHDGIYKTINIYLKVHPDLTKSEKKQLCQILDCRRLSPGLRSHAVENNRLPLRTVVQAVFFDRERPNMNDSNERNYHEFHLDNHSNSIYNTSKSIISNNMKGVDVLQLARPPEMNMSTGKGKNVVVKNGEASGSKNTSTK